MQNCDIVHFIIFSQFVPLIRARVPKTWIVLQMQCQWLEQIDAAVEPRINSADSVAATSSLKACAGAFSH